MATLGLQQPNHVLETQPGQISGVTFLAEGTVGEFRKPETFTEVVAGLNKLFNQSHININLVKAFLASYDVTKEDWNDYVTFADDTYTRNLIWEGDGKFNIVLTCWNKNQSSSIHDHSKSHCFMKMLDGELTETLFDINRDSWKLETKRIYTLQTNTVSYINDSFGLHRIANESCSNSAVSLHIYSPPFRKCQMYDKHSCRPVELDMTYNALFKERILQIKPSMRDEKVTFNSGDVTEFTRPEKMSDVIEGLLDYFSTDDVNINQVQAFLESYQPDKEEWQEYAIFDQFKYTRNLVHEGNGKFNLILLCWNKDQTSSIHDHSDAHCFMKVMDGSLTEILYDWPTQEEQEEMNKNKEGQAMMKPVRKTELPCGSVAYINDSLGLHRVCNESLTNTAVSLHVYSPPFKMCQTFNEKTGGRAKSNMTFYSKFGKKISFKRHAK